MIEMRIIKQPNYDLLVKNGKRNMRYFVQQLAYRGANFMQGIVPVRSGALRFSVSYKGADSQGGGAPEAMPHTEEHSGLTAVLGVSTPYAPYVEYGTSRFAGRRFAVVTKWHLERICERLKRTRDWTSSSSGLMR